MMKIALAVLMMLIAAGPVTAQSGAEEIKDTVNETVEIQKNTQQQQDDWAQEKSELVARFRTAQANVEYLTERKTLETEKSEALDQRIAEMRRRLNESKRLEDTVQDTLNTVLSRLEMWVARDIPFLAEERSARLSTLREEIARPDVDSAEKLRRLLEVLQVEANYGTTVEVYQDEIKVDSDPIFVDILRLGRIAIFWRTPDGKRVGAYDHGSGQWIELPNKYNRNIMRAMEMASRMRPVELIDMPLGRIAP